MTPLERKKIQDKINEEFNLYKRAGSTLLQADRIDAKTYYKNVRNKGVELGLIGEDEYPTDLPGWAEPTMRITGATLGAIAGSAGGIAGTSAGAGAGGAAATAAYRELAELLNPDLPLAPINQKFKDAGIAGATDFVGTAVFMGAGNALGNLLGRGKNLSTKQLEKLGKLTDKELAKKGASIPRRTNLFERMVQQKGEEGKLYVKEITEAFEREGLTPYLGLVTGEHIRSYFQAAGVLPIIGSPTRGAYERQIKEVVARIVGDFKNLNQAISKDGFAAISQSGNPAPYLANSAVNFAFKQKRGIGGKLTIERDTTVSPTFENLASGNSGLLLLQNIENRLIQRVNEKQAAFKDFDSALSSSSPINLNKKIVYTGKDGRQIESDSILDLLGIGAGGTKSLSRGRPNLGKASSDFMRLILGDGGRIKGSVIDGLPLQSLKQKGTLSGKDYSKLYSNVRDRITNIKSQQALGQNLSAENKHALTTLNLLKDRLEQNMAGVADDALAKLQIAKDANTALIDDVTLNKQALQFMGQSNAFKRVSESLRKDGDEQLFTIPGVKLPQGSTTTTQQTLLRDFFDSPVVAKQQQLKNLIGDTEYKGLVNAQIDDVLERELFLPLNAGKDITKLGQNLSKELQNPVMKARIVEAYGKELGTKIINNIDSFRKVTPFLLAEPNLNNFVLRNAILSKGSIGIGSVGILGYSFGGPVGSLASLGIMYGFSKLLSKPYGQKLLTQANLETASGREAAIRVRDEIMKESRVADKFNRTRERALQLTNPEAFKKYVELLRQTGIEYGGSVIGTLPTSTANEGFYR